MDLNYGPEYNEFRKEVQEFCKKYSGVIITNRKGGALTALGSAVDSDKPNGLKVKRSEWQEILLSLIHI